MRKMLIAALVLTMLPNYTFSQAKISGDVRVRPRMDVTDADGSGGDDAVTKQLILYWGRLNVDADIGGGWSFHSKLASNWVGHWSGYMGSQEVGNDVGLGNDRPTISWMELSFGKKTDNWGFRAGNLPLNGVANHIVDLHYYATSRGPVDIPWAIYHVQSIQGFNGFANLGPGKLNFALSVDANLNNSAVPAVPAVAAVNGWVDDDDDNSTPDIWGVVTEAVTAVPAVAAFGDEDWGRNKLELTFQLNFK